MVMDFWEAQRRAKSRTTFLVILFTILTAVVAALVEVGMRYFAKDSYNPPYPMVGIIFAAITFIVAGFQYITFRLNGGSQVALSLGAHLVPHQTTNFQERQLLNIVEEMAVAASLPVPPVYILENEQINAFAAGLTHDDAIVTVTRGALNTLNRDELQGVIAHELGHVSNGDVKISMRLAAMTMAFFFILYLGLRMLQISVLGRGNDKKGNPIALAAILFVVAGVFTWFFGSILKAAVSREREYLADATAVQFTRNPNGIANALRKIATMQRGQMPMHGAAFSHLYFDDHSFFSSIFRTHPPLEKRISVLEGREYIPEEWHIPKQ